MPLDPSILLDVKPLPSPQQVEDQRLTMQAKRESLIAMAQERQARAEQLRSMQQGSAQAQQIGSILQQHNGDIESAFPSLVTVNPTMALKLRDDYRKGQDEHRKAMIEQAQYGANVLAGANDGNWSIRKPLLEQVTGSPLPDQYPGDEWRDAHVALGRKEIESAKNHVVGNALVDNTGKVLYQAPEKVGSDRLVQVATPQGPQFMRESEAVGQTPYHPPTGGGSAAASGGVSDVAETIKGMKDGTLPPVMPGRGSKEYTALMAESHRQGFDLSGASTDWQATQKHIATLNGAQQTRLNQAVGQLPELLDSVEDLAKQWRAGRFPLLNKANLALAKNGAYGNKAASIATQLEQQIADVTSDLGAVYMGGNSPTDHALDLARTALNSNWSEPVLLDMVNRARKNVQIRQNSIRNTGVQGASANNPYAPQQAPAAPSGPPPGAKVRVWNPTTKRLE